MRGDYLETVEETYISSEIFRDDVYEYYQNDIVDEEDPEEWDFCIWSEKYLKSGTFAQRLNDIAYDIY
jgi:hypothetical protein